MGYCKFHPFVGIQLLDQEMQSRRYPISKSVIERFYKACEKKEEKVLLDLCYGCGLRAGEVHNIKVGDILQDKGLVLIRSGKNSKRRYVPMNEKNLSLVAAYTEEECLSKSSFLFVYQGRQKSVYLLRKLFRDLQNRIGIVPSVYSLHHLRHSIASHLVDQGLAMSLVQQFLGHSDIETTQNYVSVKREINYEIRGSK